MGRVHRSMALALLVAVLAALDVGSALAQNDRGWCLVGREDVFIGRPLRSYGVVRCESAATVGLGWGVLRASLTYGEASALREQLKAASPIDVWCVVQRTVAIAGRSWVEFAVARCDVVAGLGEWRLARINNRPAEFLTFTAAFALRDAVSAANPARLWCVGDRDESIGGRNYGLATVIRCDQFTTPWRLIARDLSFIDASAMRDSRNGGLPPVWCLWRTDLPQSLRRATFSVVRCDAALIPGWVIVRNDISFVAAFSEADTFNRTMTSGVSLPGGSPGRRCGGTNTGPGTCD